MEQQILADIVNGFAIVFVTLLLVILVTLTDKPK